MCTPDFWVVDLAIDLAEVDNTGRRTLHCRSRIFRAKSSSFWKILQYLTFLAIILYVCIDKINDVFNFYGSR